MAGGRRRKRLHLSKIYSYTCGKSSFKEDHPQIGGLGFSRVVYCNEPDCPEPERRSYAGNYVRSTKYTVASFIPKSLFEQFRRVANFYFLVSGLLALTSLAPYGADDFHIIAGGGIGGPLWKSPPPGCCCCCCGGGCWRENG